MSVFRPYTVIILLLAMGCSSRPSLQTALETGDQEIRLMRADGALQQLQETRVDYPEALELLFAIACAQQAAGASAAESGKSDGAETQFRKSMETFHRVIESPNNEFDIYARFNAATVRLLLDKTVTSDDRYLERIQNLEECIAELLEVLSDAPGLAVAQQNLDYARYQLCLLRQRPPGESEDEKEDSEGKTPPAPSVIVDSATTQIPDARAEVLEDGTIMLHLPTHGETNQ